MIIGNHFKDIQNTKKNSTIATELINNALQQRQSS